MGAGTVVEGEESVSRVVWSCLSRACDRNLERVWMGAWATWQARSKQERSEKCETAREGVCFWRGEGVGRPSHHLSRRSPEPQSAACVCAMGAKPSALALGPLHPS